MSNGKQEGFEIKWGNATRFLGRNGPAKSSGVYVEFIPRSISMNKIGTVRLIPLTSLGHLARCEVEVPGKKLAELIELLKGFCETEPQKDPRVSAFMDQKDH